MSMQKVSMGTQMKMMRLVIFFFMKLFTICVILLNIDNVVMYQLFETIWSC